MKKDLIRSTVETAVLVALAVVLDKLFELVPFFKMPNGGHISLCMLPILIIGLRRGLGFGLAGSILYGLLNFIFDGLVLHIGSIFFDYVFAFGVFGLSGLFKGKITNPFKLCLLLFSLCFIRYLFHGLSGAIFFAEYAYIPEGINWTISESALPWVYSFVFYNLPYMGISTLLCIAVAIPLFPLINYKLENGEEK